MQIQRESIFVSALRGFCRSLFIMLGIFIAIAIGIFAIGALSSPYEQAEKTVPELLPDLNWQTKAAPLSAPAILQVNIHGPIGMKGTVDTQHIQSILFDSRAGLFDNNRVKAILLHVNTPGGTVTDSDNIYRMLLKYKEKFHVPIFAYIDSLCASGGMYIISAADRVYGSPTAVVGSVGVISGPYFNFTDTMSKIGVQAQTLTEGTGKDALNPFRPWKPEENETYQQLIRHYYEQFVDIVAQGRPRVDKQKLIDEYGAKVFDVTTAEQIGYVDVANSSYETAMLDLMKEANIDPQSPYQIVELKPKKRFFNELVNGSCPLINGKVAHTFDFNKSQTKEMPHPISYLYEP